MIKTICAVSILTADLLFASQPVKAAWLCGPEQCVWVHHHVAVVPAFAATWAPPRQSQVFLAPWHLWPLAVCLSLDLVSRTSRLGIQAGLEERAAVRFGDSQLVST